MIDQFSWGVTGEGIEESMSSNILIGWEVRRVAKNRHLWHLTLGMFSSHIL